MYIIILQSWLWCTLHWKNVQDISKIECVLMHPLKCSDILLKIDLKGSWLVASYGLRGQKDGNTFSGECGCWGQAASQIVRPTTGRVLWTSRIMWNWRSMGCEAKFGPEFFSKAVPWFNKGLYFYNVAIISSNCEFFIAKLTETFSNILSGWSKQIFNSLQDRVLPSYPTKVNSLQFPPCSNSLIYFDYFWLFFDSCWIPNLEHLSTLQYPRVSTGERGDDRSGWSRLYARLFWGLRWAIWLQNWAAGHVPGMCLSDFSTEDTKAPINVHITSIMFVRMILYAILSWFSDYHEYYWDFAHFASSDVQLQIS